MSDKPIRSLQLTSRYDVEILQGFEFPHWDEFVQAHEVGHHVQSTPWARFQATRGWTPLRLVFREGGSIVGLAQVLVRRLPFFGSIAYLDHGPLVDEERPQLVEATVKELQHLAADQVRMLIVQPATARVADAMAAAGFLDADLGISLAATVQVDLSHSEDELLARMKSKTRYNIRKGLRSGVVIRTGDAEDLGAFHSMLSDTAQRQGFTPNKMQYFVDLHREMADIDGCLLFIAEDDAGPIASILLVVFGDRAVYKRGAWSGRSGNLHPNEALHWSAMKWAREAGLRYYDFDGIRPDIARAAMDGRSLAPDATESVSRFKLGFGGDIVIKPSAVGYIPSSILRFGYNRVFWPLRHTAMARRVTKRLQSG